MNKYLKLLIALFSLTFLLSCNNEAGETDRAKLLSIDFSYNNGWTYVRSLTIDSFGVMNIVQEDIKKRELRVECQLTDQEYRTLDSMLYEIKTEGIPDSFDPEEFGTTDDISRFSILVHYSDSDKIELVIENYAHESTTEEKKVYKVLHYLNELAEKKIDKLKNRKFKTRNNYFVIPPPPPLIN